MNYKPNIHIMVVHILQIKEIIPIQYRIVTAPRDIFLTLLKLAVRKMGILGPMLSIPIREFLGNIMKTGLVLY